MPSLWFVVPVHGRLPLAAICLRQLRRTCDALAAHRIDATAVIVADRDNLTALHDLLGETLGFWAVERDNKFLSRKFNDGIELACRLGADYVVPCGSDDWVDRRLFLDLPAPNEVYGFQHMCFVREDGLEMTDRAITYTGGCGIRIYPRQVMETLDYRPADEDRPRGCDTSILTNLLQSERPPRVFHVGLDPRQIVDWKSPEEQLNPYESLRRHRSVGSSDPFVALADMYPAAALEEMAAHYGRVAVAA